MDNLLSEVQEIFRAVLDQPDVVVDRESNAASIDGWDSLTHINLIVSIEKKFQIKFVLGELKELENVGDMLDLIQKKLDNRSKG